MIDKLSATFYSVVYECVCVCVRMGGGYECVCMHV